MNIKDIFKRVLNEGEVIDLNRKWSDISHLKPLKSFDHYEKEKDFSFSDTHLVYKDHNYKERESYAVKYTKKGNSIIIVPDRGKHFSDSNITEFKKTKEGWFEIDRKSPYYEDAEKAYKQYLKHNPSNLIVPAKDIKFMYNGIKIENRVLFKAVYSIGPYIGPNRDKPKDTIVIRKWEYDPFPPMEGLNIKNETDIMDGTYDRDHIYVEPGSKYYKQVYEAYLKQEERRNKKRQIG